MNSHRFEFGVWILCFGIIAVTSIHAQEYIPDLDDFLDSGAAFIEEASDGEYTLDRKLFSEKSVTDFFGVLDEYLELPSLDELARLLPAAESTLAHLDGVEGLRPYLDWLHQRIDYVTIAERAVRAFPDTPKPPPEVERMPSPPPQKSNRDRYVGSTRIWEENLRKRPEPTRAGTLVPRLKPIFHKQGVPEQLVWLAEVESSFNPGARSPVGAAGLYQFMPRTAESLGLTLRPRDERLNPGKSAEAAATYLKMLYRRFDTWPLTLAAYNAGQGRVSKLLKKHDASTFDEISAYLPSETRMYVPKVFATIKLREGIEAQSLPAPAKG